MRQLVILSGKGGTGKTTVASALIRLSGARACADCDVDAPNLHLVNRHYSSGETAPYWGLPLADIDPVLCTACGECEVNCRFGAIIPGAPHRVDPYACEGCGVCVLVCPTDAINMRPHEAGTMTLYAQENRVFSTAQLRTGAGTSGLLVSQVKKRMNEAMKEDIPLAIVDGSPGIGCPVIAAIGGATLILAVVEPTLSGKHDMERVLDLAAHFKVPAKLLINKYDLNSSMAEAIAQVAAERGVACVGRIPFDRAFTLAMVQGQTVFDYPGADDRKEELRQIWAEVLAALPEDKQRLTLNMYQ